MSGFKESVRALLRKLRRGSTATRNARQLLRGFDAFGIDLVFDVGANTGQFAREIRDNGFRGRIVSFEPLSHAHRQLTAAAASDPSWSVHERCALGDKAGSAVLNIAGNSVSSSVLEMAAAHEAAAPGSAYVGREETALVTLDSVADRYLGDSERPFLKIDTQGFEWQVLTGAEKTLPSIRGVLCELSLVTLYEGQHLWREVVDRLEESGFTLWGVQPSFMDQRGRNLQADAIFFRER
ncbi:MAG TPA: FkbM family methyltransferase [Gammaproteobacteria bacterium]|nr:FkbM family methyltransferase [Gammaproteobacteria bacterium]